MNYPTILAIIAIAVAMGVVAITPMLETQQANAWIFFKHHGCGFFSNGFFHSHFRCFHPG